MPTYEYVCDKGHRFDAMRTVSKRMAAVVCPDCNGSGTLAFAPNANVLVPIGLHTEWAMVAPRDAEGRPMTKGETVRDGRFKGYNPDERYRVEAYERSLQADRERTILEQSKRDAWKDRKVTIKSKRGKAA